MPLATYFFHHHKGAADNGAVFTEGVSPFDTETKRAVVYAAPLTNQIHDYIDQSSKG